MARQRPINYLIALCGLLVGCVTAKNRSVEIPAANITAVYEPPSTTAVSAEIIAAIILIAVILYIIFEKYCFRRPGNKLK